MQTSPSEKPCSTPIPIAPEPRGVVIWVTGRPSAGKSTLAAVARNELVRRGHVCVILDGDAVREAIVPPHGYTSGGRDDFYETLARLAAMLCAQGLVVLVPATGNRASYRSQARELASSFIEVFVDTPPDECERRDDKGLYARARSGELDNMPSSTATFEEPVQPDLVAHGGKDMAAIRRVVEMVSRIAV